MKTLYALITLLICLVCDRTSAQSVSQTEHFKDVDQRGDKAMGFSHELTSHHFLLFKDGGAIEIEATKPDDSVSKEAIRDHLLKIAEMFSQGDFELPMLIHATIPPGVDTMKRLKTEISYNAEIAQRGALLRITTGNSEALQAIHDFLRFQIADHRTKDSLQVSE